MEAPLGFGFVLTLGIFLPDFEGILSSPNPIHLDLHSNVFPFYCKLKKFVLVFSVFPVFLGVGDGAEATEINDKFIFRFAIHFGFIIHFEPT